MTLSPGVALSHYRIIGTLGAGGMGEVYLAEDLKLDRRVAIKVLAPSFSSDPDRLRRFLREAKTTSALNHPHIAQIYEIGEEDGASFLVLEYIEGDTLRDMINQGPLPVSQVVKLALELADALAEAHSRGIIHRDLKLENIMVTRRGHAKILDFGLAKVHTPEGEAPSEHTLSLTNAGTVVGTVNYMSPEQALGREVDGRSDLFSLGIVLYRIASGNQPFSGQTATEILSNIIHVAPPPMKDEGNPAGPELTAVILKCLEKDPAKRYQSANDLSVDLRLISAHLQREGSSPTATMVVPKASRRSKTLVWAVAIVILIAAAALAWKQFGGRHSVAIAVLPIVNSTGDPQQEYLASGLTESLIDDLQRVAGLRAISFSNIQRFERNNPRDAAQRMHADAVLSGELVNQAIHMSLIDVKNGNELWQHQYTRVMMAMLDVKQEIVHEVSRSLEREDVSSPKKGAAESAGYDLYLKGRYAVNQRTNESIQQGLDDLKKSIEMNPSYAPAFVGLAHGFVNLAFTGTQPATLFFPSAVDATQKALVLDPKLVDAHCEMGYLKALSDYDWVGAEREFQAALALNPDDASSHELYAMWVLAPTGRRAKALTEIDRALNDDPQSIMVSFHKSWILYEFREYPDARAQLEKTIGLDPDFLFSHLVLGLTLLQQGQNAEAETAANALSYTAGGNARQLTTLAYVMARTGNHEKLDPLLREIEARMQHGYEPPFNVARIYAALGQMDRAFQLLNQAYTDRDPGLIPMPVDPTGDVFRADPRYDALLRKMNLKN
jgi:eukaryotic-like serine/threonine-protein kinase